MKVAIDLSLPAVDQALALVLAAFGHTVTASAEADLVIASEPRKLLAHLKQGKLVIQFLCNSLDAVASGLATSPEFGERFRAYQVVGWRPGVPIAEDMYVHLQSLVQEER